MLIEDHQLLLLVTPKILHNKLTRTVPANTTYSDIINKGRK